jgi:hypothetical protein
MKMAVGAAIGGLLFAAGHRALAAAAWAGAAVLGSLALASPRWAAWLAAAFAAVGRAAGRLTSTVLLGALFLLVLTPVRWLRRLGGADDLRLRPSAARSFWLDSDAETHKRRYAGAMFATELRRPRRAALLPLLLGLAALLAIAEIVLRLHGFGPGAVVYVAHPRVGYYPAPHQLRARYGGRVETNRYGMRAPDFDEVKPAGTFRILMLGDSTLWGGSYVDQDRLYARILERRLNEAAGAGRRVEVLNMGVNGWGPFHESGFVETFGTFAADLVMVCLPADDVERERYGLMSLPYFQQGAPPWFGLEEVVMHTAWRYRRSRIGHDPGARDMQRMLGTREYERLLRMLRDGPAAAPSPEPVPPARGIGDAEVFLQVLPSRSAGLGGPPLDGEQQIVDELLLRARTLGVQADYPAGLFKDHGTADELYHDASHLQEGGHAVYAAFLAERVATRSARFKAWQAAQP